MSIMFDLRYFIFKLTIKEHFERNLPLVRSRFTSLDLKESIHFLGNLIHLTGSKGSANKKNLCLKDAYGIGDICPTVKFHRPTGPIFSFGVEIKMITCNLNHFMHPFLTVCDV